MKNLLLFVLICTISCYYGFAGIEPSDALRRAGSVVDVKLLEKAKSGDAESQDLLGEAYIHGNIIPGIPRDEAQGFYCWKRLPLKNTQKQSTVWEFATQTVWAFKKICEKPTIYF